MSSSPEGVLTPQWAWPNLNHTVVRVVPPVAKIGAQNNVGKGFEYSLGENFRGENARCFLVCPYVFT